MVMFVSEKAGGLKRFCSCQGSGSQTYGYIPRHADAAMDKIGQIPQGRRNGFDLASARPCRWNRHVRRPREADIFAISAPRACADQKLPLVISKPTPASAVEDRKSTRLNSSH